MALDLPVDIDDRVRAIELFAPWFYDFDLAPYGKTVSKLREDVRQIHQTRLQMLNRVLEPYLAPDA